MMYTLTAQLSFATYLYNTYSLVYLLNTIRFRYM